MDHTLQKLFDSHLISDVLTHAPLDVCIRCCNAKLNYALQVREVRKWDEGTLAYCLVQQNLIDFANRVKHVQNKVAYAKGWRKLTDLNEDDFYVTAAVLHQATIEFPYNNPGVTMFSHSDMLNIMTHSFRKDCAALSFIFCLHPLKIEMHLSCVRVNSHRYVFDNGCSLVVTKENGFKVQLFFNPVSLCLLSDQPLTHLEFNCVLVAGLMCPSSNQKYNMRALNNFVKRIK